MSKLIIYTCWEDQIFAYCDRSLYLSQRLFRARRQAQGGKVFVPPFDILVHFDWLDVGRGRVCFPYKKQGYM